ncbi:Hemin transport protein HmuS [Minicystis rosea]|nr:Hemin transport protein HmuS [Minicystis rosea]
MKERLEDRAMDLKTRHAEYRATHPHAHPREAAEALGVTEAQLIAARCGDGVTRLDERWKELFEALPSLGEVKTMTRNPSAVLERWGAFNRVEIEGPMGQVVGADIDLRLFLRNFRRAFAVVDPAPNGKLRRSLQLFDAQGVSVHKVYLDDEARLADFEALVSQHTSPDQSTEEPADPAPPAPKPAAEVDVEAFRAGWDAMQDTHEFFGLMRKFGLTRTQALGVAGGERAYPVAASSLEQVLRAVAADEIKIMIFVGNRGMIQIHSGLVHRIDDRGGWLNVLDPRFNLHVRADEVAEAWVVRKPTSDGIVTSLELFDGKGETVLLMFGYRKPRMEEDARWRGVIASLRRLSAAESQ